MQLPNLHTPMQHDTLSMAFSICHLLHRAANSMTAVLNIHSPGFCSGTSHQIHPELLKLVTSMKSSLLGLVTKLATLT